MMAMGAWCSAVRLRMPPCRSRMSRSTMSPTRASTRSAGHSANMAAEGNRSLQRGAAQAQARPTCTLVGAEEAGALCQGSNPQAGWHLSVELPSTPTCRANRFIRVESATFTT